MARIIPFKGLTYNPRKVRDLTEVVAPPYDVIWPEEQKKLYEKSAENIVRLTLSREAKPYEAVAKLFRRWQRDGTLVPEDRAAIYYLTQQFSLRGEQEKTRRGYIALAEIEDFATGKIHGHEATLAEPKEDRLRLMLACHAQFSSIFALYNEQKPTLTNALEERVEGVKPKMEVTYGDYGLSRLWAITDPETIEEVQRRMADQPVFIADGHHRYEAAWNYRNRLRLETPGWSGQEGFNYVMMYFTNLQEDGVVILPTHRLLQQLPKVASHDLEESLQRYFYIEPYPKTKEGQQWFLRALRSGAQKRHLIGASFKGDPRYLILRLKNKRTMQRLAKDTSPELRGLDVTTLHVLLMEHILGVSTRDAVNTDTVSYTHDELQALGEVEKGNCGAAFILNPPQAEELIQVSLKGEKMPQKSTYFFPKLLTGLVINKIV